MLIHRRTMLATLLASGVTSLAAQGRVGCASGAPIATLGTLTLDCVQCTIHTGADRWIEYGAEPTVKRSTGGSDGVRAGDVLVSIDGALITTPIGARRLANPNPDRPSTLVVRRDGKQVTLSVPPDLRCPVNVVVRSAVGDTVYRGGFGVGSGYGAGAGSAARGGFGGRLVADSELRAEIARAVTARAAGAAAGSVAGRMARIQADSVAAIRDRIASGVIARRTVDSAIASIDALPVDRVRDAMAARSAAGGFSGAMVARRNDSASARIDALPVDRVREAVAARSGWLGFGLECSNCSAKTLPNGRTEWQFTAAPAIAGVEPDSPAELAGLQIGDIVREIDGVAMTWPAGAAKFSNIQPGQKVKFTILRNGKQREVVVTAGKRLARG